MLPSVIRPKCEDLYKYTFSVAIHFLMAATFHVPGVCIFWDYDVHLHHRFFTCALAISRVRFFSAYFTPYGKILIFRCRSPPSDFDFASYQLKKSKLEDI